MDNEVILQRLKNEDKETLEFVYKQCRNPFFETLKYDRSCEVTDIRELYQIAILKFYENIQEGKLQNLTNLEGYIIGIGRNLCKEFGRKQNHVLPLLDWFLYEDFLHTGNTNEVEEQERLARVVANTLAELSESCQAILKARYYNHWSMEKIAEELGYQSPAVVRNSKYRCIKKFRTRFKELNK